MTTPSIDLFRIFDCFYRPVVATKSLAAQRPAKSAIPDGIALDPSLGEVFLARTGSINHVTSNLHHP